MLKPGDGNSERLKQAVRLHQAGRLEEAEAIYQALLQEEPDQAEILNVSGALACQRKDFAGAIRRISQAMALAPQAPDYVCNLAKVYYQQGQLEQAIDSFLAVLDLAPQHREARRNLAALYQARGENQLALAQYQALVAIDPQDASACNNLGNLLLERGEPESAAAYYLQALQAQPEHLNARNNLGKIRLLQGRLPEALAAFEQVLKLRPDHLQALFQAGISLQSMNRYPEALVYYVRAEQLEPGNAKIQLNLAVSLFTLGRDAEALHHCRAALRLEPDNPDIHSNLGLIQERQGRISEALASYHRALELQPDDARIHNNQGNAYRAQGKLEQALAAYRRALALRPDYPIAHRNLLLTLNYLPHLTADEIFAEHRAWGQQTERYYLPASGHANLPDSGRCLRVGYVSSVFRHHAVAFFVEPVLTAHDRQQVEVFCYADLIAPDAVTRRLQAHADHWREIQTLDTRAVAALIRQDRIDILVDLDGHTAHNRLEVFALKPAPVQVSYVGYPNTTGLGTMDYRITDAWADPVGQNDEFYTEQLLRLPRNFSCYAPPAESPEVAALPALTTGCVTFGSFNNLCKLTPEVVALWARVLQTVPGSRLLLKSKALADAATAADFLAQFAAHGIAAARLSLVGEVAGFTGHLAAYAQVDIALDPFPFTGATTSCEALWMGVPVITLAGSSHVARVGVSLLTSVGMEALIADDEAQYVAIAAQLAGDLTTLAALRQGLRGRMAASPLCDALGYTRELEAAYRRMWHCWCHRSGSPEAGPV